MRLNLKILVFMTALAVFQHLGGRGHDYRDVDPSAYCMPATENLMVMP